MNTEQIAQDVNLEAFATAAKVPFERALRALNRCLREGIVWQKDGNYFSGYKTPDGTFVLCQGMGDGKVMAPIIETTARKMGCHSVLIVSNRPGIERWGRRMGFVKEQVVMRGRLDQGEVHHA